MATYMFYKQFFSIYSHDIVFIPKFQDIKLSFSIFSVSLKVRIEHYNSPATTCWETRNPYCQLNNNLLTIIRAYLVITPTYRIQNFRLLCSLKIFFNRASFSSLKDLAIWSCGSWIILVTVSQEPSVTCCSLFDRNFPGSGRECHSMSYFLEVSL